MRTALDTAETFYFNEKLARGPHPVAAWAAMLHPHLERRLEIPNAATKDVAAYAYVNRGRWVVDCPFCTSAQVAAFSDHRFLCGGPDGCHNAEVGGRFVKVIWPTKKQCDEIALALLARPDVDTQNWRPGETVKFLIRENAERGVV